MLKSLRQLILKSRCAICRRFTFDVFCPNCLQQLKSCQSTFPLFPGDFCPIFAWGQYQGLLRQTIIDLKYHQQPQIGQVLGQLLGLAWLDTRPQSRNRIVVPIPLHQLRQEERGYNQAALIAGGFCHVTGLGLTLEGLRRVRPTVAQFSLSLADRQTNVAQAFQPGRYRAPRGREASVVLVDDIYTTGATVRAAAETLRQAGLKVSEIAVVAKT